MFLTWRKLGMNPKVLHLKRLLVLLDNIPVIVPHRDEVVRRYVRREAVRCRQDVTTTDDRASALVVGHLPVL